MESKSNIKGIYVWKRAHEGRPAFQQRADCGKIQGRLQKLKDDVERAHGGRSMEVDVWQVARTTNNQLYKGVTTAELDSISATICSTNKDHPDYQLFAGCILMDDLMARNRDHMSFRTFCERAYGYVNPENKRRSPLISDELMQIGREYGEIIDQQMDLSRNYLYDYFAAKTLINGEYLLSEFRPVRRKNAWSSEMVAISTPQHMFMRVALGIWGANLHEAFKLYHLMSLRRGTMATPTLFNAGTPKPQLSSCFLVAMKDDSIEGIFDTNKEVAVISKHSGGIGMHVHNIRSAGSHISGTNGTSNGLVPMLRVFNNTALYVDQGGGKRHGSFAIYLEPWHADIWEFLHLKLMTKGSLSERALDLFYALWIPDLYFERLDQAMRTDPDEYERNPVMWSLMDPAICTGLADAYGADFKALYEGYEAKSMFNRQIDIKTLEAKICEVAVETGTPYVLSKGNVNKKSNHSNLGTIRSSNLCTEIMEFSSPDETAVCNLASVSLPAHVKADRTYDFEALIEDCRTLTRTLDRVIDINFYPREEAHRSNMRNRPIGLGVQGMADAFAKMRIPYGGAEGKRTNAQIAEAMLYGCLVESHALTQELDPVTDLPVGPYPSIDENGGAPIRRGLFSQDLWLREHKDSSLWIKRALYDPALAHLCKWDDLKAKVVRDGVRNSLVRANMPTASTSAIMGNNEAFVPFLRMMYIRSTKNGQFLLVNRYLVEWLSHYQAPGSSEVQDLWTLDLADKIRANEGSVQGLPEVPADVQAVFKGQYEMKLSTLTMMARDRSIFIDQGESLNIFIPNQPNMSVKMILYKLTAWKLGLKTLSYYTRTKQKNFMIDFASSDNQKGVADEEEECVTCSA